MSTHRIPLHILLLLLFLVVAFPLTAAVVERTQLADPRSELIPAVPGRVVASDAGMFLVHGQRITTEGVNLDAEPIPGTDGAAVGWHDGWLIIRSTETIHTIRHLRSDGSLEPFAELPRAGQVLSAASNDGRLAMLERNHAEQRIWIIVIGEEGLVRREPLTSARLDGGVIRRFGNGFLVVSHVRASQSTSRLHAWRVRADGVAQAIEEIGDVAVFSSYHVAVGEERAVLTMTESPAPGMRRVVVRVIDAALVATAPIEVPIPLGTDLMSLFPLPLNEGFLVSYRLRWGGETESRAMVISPDGTLVSDTGEAPIVQGDRLGSLYLVLRPWGDAGIAEDDPRRVIAALQMKQRLYQPPVSLETVVSGGVTLTSFLYRKTTTQQQPGGKFFVRFDAEGDPIDQEPVVFPGELVIAIPDGFAFISREQATIRMQRLARRGGWIDAEPVILTTMATGVPALTADATATDLLVAWATREEIVWSRFDLEGAPLQEALSRVDRSGARGMMSISISRRGDERLILVYDVDYCEFTCLILNTIGTLALDREGEPVGPLHELDEGIWPTAIPPRAIALGDGTWAVPGFNGGRVLHLARDGSLLRISSHPLLDNLLTVEPTALGWRAIAKDPLRIVEVVGLDDPARLTGLEGMATAQFAFGDWLAFFADAPGPEETTVPWNGRLETVEGDLSVRLLDAGRDERGRLVRLVVRNEGATVATGIRLETWWYQVLFGPDRKRDSIDLPPLAPGETAYVSASIGTASDPRFWVLSEDIEDIEPADNTALLSEAEPAPPRRRSSRR
jgi:hypothetical protein